MKITSHTDPKETALGYPFIYKLYEPIVPSSDYLIFLHGAGEVGPLDGSNLDEVEKHGYPLHAKNGFEFPFNIIAPQSAIDHRNLMKTLPAYVKLKYKARAVMVTGLSLGGYGTYDAKLVDRLELIYAIAPVCGAGRITLVNDYPEMKAWHFHGDQDPTVKLGTAKGFIDKYNLLHPASPIKLTIYPGVGHAAWVPAYDITPGKDDLLKWIIKVFAEAPSDFNKEAFRQKIIDFVKTVN